MRKSLVDLTVEEIQGFLKDAQIDHAYAKKRLESLATWDEQLRAGIEQDLAEADRDINDLQTELSRRNVTL